MNPFNMHPVMPINSFSYTLNLKPLRRGVATDNDSCVSSDTLLLQSYAFAIPVQGLCGRPPPFGHDGSLAHYIRATL